MFIVHIIIFIFAFIILECSGSKFKDKRSIPEKVFDIAMFLFAAMIMLISATAAWDILNI